MRPVISPVPGMVRKVLVRPYDPVAKGQILFELVTFDMVQQIPAPVAGMVRLLLVKNGAQVNEGTVLAELES